MIKLDRVLVLIEPQNIITLDSNKSFDTSQFYDTSVNLN